MKTDTSWCSLLQEALDQSPIDEAVASTEVLLRAKLAREAVAREDENAARHMLKDAILRSDEYQTTGKYLGREPNCEAIYQKVRAALEADGRL